MSPASSGGLLASRGDRGRGRWQLQGVARVVPEGNSGADRRDLATQLLAGGEVPGSVLIPVTTQLELPMSELGTTVPGRASMTRAGAACGEHIGQPACSHGEALTYELLDGAPAVESGELPAETLIRLHLANGSGLSEDWHLPRPVCVWRWPGRPWHALELRGRVQHPWRRRHLVRMPGRTAFSPVSPSSRCGARW